MMIDTMVPQMRGLDSLIEAINTVPIPGAPPRLSKDGAAVGLAFLDIALRQNHVRRLTERLTLIEHRSARCSTEVDISLGMLDEEQRMAGRLYQRIRSRGAPTEDGQQAVLWVPVSLARRSHAPVDVINGEGDKLPRLTQYETSRLLASAMYRLFRLILSSHPDVAERDRKPLYDFLHRIDKPRWLVQAALTALLTERNKPASASAPSQRTPGTVDGRDAEHRKLARDIFRRYESTLGDYFGLLEHAVNDYLLVVALDPAQDEHLLAFDTPLNVEPGTRSQALKPFRLVSGGYWVEYRTRLPAGLRAYHLVAQTEQGLEIDTMSLMSNADRSAAQGLAADLRTLADAVDKEKLGPTSRRGEKRIELELQGRLRKLSELLRRRRWEASKAGMTLAQPELSAVHALDHAARSGEAVTTPERVPNSALFHHALVTPVNLRQAADEMDAQQLEYDLSLESEPASSLAHVYWRRDPARTDVMSSITIWADMFIRDSSDSREGIIIAYVLGVSAIAYLLGCLRLGTYWPFYGPVALQGAGNADAVIAVLLLVPGFLYTRLNLPQRRSIAVQVRRLPRLVAHVTIASAAVLATAFAASENAELIRWVLLGCVAVPLLVALFMVATSRAMVPDHLPVTSRLPAWIRTGTRTTAPSRRPGVLAAWWWKRKRTHPDAIFSTTSLDSIQAREEGR
jgi:hypothetical protein